MASTKRARDDKLTEKDSQKAKDTKTETSFVVLQKERDKRVSDIESQVMKQQMSFDMLSTVLNKIRGEEMSEKRKIEEAFNLKKQQQVVAPRRALLSKIKGFWAAVLMKVTTDDNCPAHVPGGWADCSVLAFATDFVYTEAGGEDEGFTVSVSFSENPFFSNPALSSQVRMPPTGAMTVISTSISWKEGHGLKDFGGEGSFISMFDSSLETEFRLGMLDEALRGFKVLHEDPLSLVQEDMDDEEDEDDDEEEDEWSDDEEEEDGDDDDEDDGEEEEEEDDDDDDDASGEEK